MQTEERLKKAKFTFKFEDTGEVKNHYVVFVEYNRDSHIFSFVALSEKGFSALVNRIMNKRNFRLHSIKIDGRVFELNDLRKCTTVHDGSRLIKIVDPQFSLQFTSECERKQLRNKHAKTLKSAEKVKIFAL